MLGFGKVCIGRHGEAPGFQIRRTAKFARAVGDQFLLAEDTSNDYQDASIGQSWTRCWATGGGERR